MQRAKQKPPSPSYSPAEATTDVDSSMANSACPRELPPPSQDSSWASYISDFVATQQEEATSNGRSSLVVCERPSSRKRKVTTEDDPLEDTACSSPPVKPPKARVSSETGRATCDTLSQVDAGFAKINDVRINEVHDVMKSPNDSCGQTSDLRKKGLCLVPLSMLIDFLQ